MLLPGASYGQTKPEIPSRPDPKEIPLPVIPTSMKAMPGVDQLPDHPGMPDALIMNNGHRVQTAKQWQQRREELKQTLEYYAVGQAPPPPGNVKGKEISSQLLADGKVRYRLVHLTFGPNESLSMDIGIFTPASGGAVPAIISPSGTPPGATPLPRLPQGVNQGKGQDVLLVTGPMEPGATRELPPGAREGQPAATRRGPFSPRTAEEIASTNPAIAHGYGFVTFNNNDCGEDTTLRLRMEAGRFARRVSILHTRTTIGDFCGHGRGASPVSSIIYRPIRRLIKTS